MDTHNSSASDSFWDACRYLTIEASAEESAAFEARLGEDQAAREDLAQAVEITQILLAIGEPVGPAEVVVMPPARLEYWLQPVGWIAVGAAACLAAVMFFQTVLAPSLSADAKLADASSDELAQAWLLARTGVEGEASPVEPADGLTPGDVHGDLLAVESDGISDLSSSVDSDMAPSWMLVAVQDAQPVYEEN